VNVRLRLLQNQAPPVILSVAKDLKKVKRDDVESPDPWCWKFNTWVETASEILRYAQDDRGSLVP
jgi:hypothetical protein